MLYILLFTGGRYKQDICRDWMYFNLDNKSGTINFCNISVIGKKIHLMCNFQIVSSKSRGVNKGLKENWSTVNLTNSIHMCL